MGPSVDAGAKSVKLQLRTRGADMTTRVHHPIFARMYKRIAAEAEDKGASEHRDELLAGLAGRVVEVGAGTGLNFAHYPNTVSEVVAVEPESYLRTVAEAAIAQ